MCRSIILLGSLPGHVWLAGRSWLMRYFSLLAGVIMIAWFYIDLCASTSAGKRIAIVAAFRHGEAIHMS